MMQAIQQGAGALRARRRAARLDVMTSILKAGESGEVVTLTTTCERPAALGPDEALALLK